MSSNGSTQAIALKQGVRPYQLMVGFVLSVAMLMLGTSGVAGATSNTQGKNSASHSKEDCRKGGWKTMGYKSQGACVSAAAKHHGHGNGGGHGYGGNNGNNIGIGISVNGDNNIINVIVNFLFG